MFLCKHYIRADLMALICEDSGNSSDIPVPQSSEMQSEHIVR